ncbi:integration host factor subunit beta [Algoriphagus sp. NF]|uniref:Integration host factor subunit beta n=2 Tax=Algoriphagus TaxID=246875 RepID=A0ABS7N6I4_9BACT|nr:MULTISPECIES: HU family DNA-binding protein [Algoriphagus]MBY5951946.1 integration host factor subunit beta [Algoriphagus marincola]MCR9082128.1 integration host factor subunit beta [Cyclobacteriaceae bacterium]MDE0560253.1 integration host factor subunit beta [Algoriphagus sp. NF]TDK44323.1 integration host factor subunit beta [Algoriphagus aquimaris]
MTKAEVITKISDMTGIQKDDVTQTVEAFFSVVKESMAEGENIYVRGFGSFINKKRAKKIARNISKNTAIVIDEHYIPAFKPSKVFIEKIKSSDKIKELAPQE